MSKPKILILCTGNTCRSHWPFEDLPKAAREGESDMDAFRRIRNEISKVFGGFAKELRKEYS